MANELVVTDLVIAKDRSPGAVRNPVNVPQRNYKLFRGRIGVVMSTNFNYDDDTGIPLATLSGDAITAGILYTIGCKRKTDLIWLQAGPLFAGGLIHAAAEIQASATTSTYTKGSGNWLTGMTPVAGEYVVGSAFTNAGNNGLKTVLSATANTVVVSGSLTTESGGADEQLTLFRNAAGGGGVCLLTQFDDNLFALRVFGPDVTTAGTRDNVIEVADNTDLRSAANLGTTAVAAAWFDLKVEFFSSDGT